MPDTYQGTELWDFSLVDPDNRRPVDYDRRRRMLQDLRSAVESAGGDLRDLARDLVAAKEDGRIKLYVTHRSLALPPRPPRALHRRRVHPPGRRGPEGRAPVRLRPPRRPGPPPSSRCRGWSPGWPPTRPARRIGAEVWPDTRLPLTGLDPALRWRNLFTGEVLTPEVRDGQPSLAAADLFAHFPVALLLAERAN